MAICPVCNCKTDALDIVKIQFPFGEVDGCSFCQRQLKTFLGEGGDPTDANIRWLKAVIEKDVPQRNEEILKFLKSVSEKYGETLPEPPAKEPPAAVAYGQDTNPKPKKEKITDFSSDERKEIAELRKRIDNLENQIRKMKRTQQIKTIIELGAPFAMLILLLIIFFASGLYDNLLTIFSMAGI